MDRERRADENSVGPTNCTSKVPFSPPMKREKRAAILHSAEQQKNWIDNYANFN
jgi:hypothetical protein